MSVNVNEKVAPGKRVRRGLFAELPVEAQARFPFEGLYEAEWKRREAGRRSQAALTPEQRDRQLASLTASQVRFRARTSSAGALPVSEPSDSPSTQRTPAKRGRNWGETAGAVPPGAVSRSAPTR